jgi:flagellar hook-associated protein 1 FlgK
MGDLFDIGKAGISAYKSSLAATGQNIANVGTEGYARRDASIEEISLANSDILTISKTSGLGVRMGGITRAFDQFLDLQLQNASSSFSFSKSKSEILNRLEDVLLPKSATVSTRIGEFFNGINSLAQDPSDMNLRTLALTGAKAVSREISNLHLGLSDLRTLTQDTLSLAAGELNTNLKNLSNIQKEILGNANKSGAPNSLLDKRDSLLSNISQLADISVEYHKNGGVTVSLGKFGEVATLLEGNSFNEISFKTDDHGIKSYLNGPNGNLSSIHFSSGQLAGLVSADSLTGKTISEVDDLAQKFVAEINSIHRMGLDLNGDRGTDLFSLDAVSVQKAAANRGGSSLRTEGFNESLAGSKLEMIFDAELGSWSVFSSNGEPIPNFVSRLELGELSIMAEGQPKDGDKFFIEVTDTSGADMAVLISDASKFAAAGLHSVEPDIKNLGSSKLNIGYFDESTPLGNSNLQSLFSETRNAANPVSFNSLGVLGVIENVGSIEELSILKSQSSLRIFTDLTQLSSSDQLSVTLNSTNYTFNISSVFDDLDTTNDLAEILNNGAIVSNSSLNSFRDLGLRAVASGSSFVISSAAQASNSNFPALESGSLGRVSGILAREDTGLSDLSVFTKEGIQISGKTLSEDEVTKYLTKENGFSSEAIYRANYLPTSSSEGFSGANVTRKTTEGLDVISLSGAGFPDGINNNVSIYASNAFPTNRTQLAGPVSVTTASGRSTSVTFESGMMAGQIAENLSTGLSSLGISATASNLVELSGIANGLVEFELVGNNLSTVQISTTVSNGSHIGLISQINSFSDTTGIKAYSSGNSGVILEHVDAGDIALKTVKLGSGVGISVNQLDQFGDRLLTNSKTLSDGQHLVIGGAVQMKSTSDFTASYNGNNLNSTNSAFDMGFSNKSFDIENDHTDISFYANYKMDSGYADASNVNVVSSASKYSLTLSDPVSGNLESSFLPQKADEFSTGVISSRLASNFRDMATSTVFYGDTFDLTDGFPSDGSQIQFSIGEQTYTATLNIDEDVRVQGTNVIVGTNTYSGSAGLSELISSSKFVITGAEADRLTMNFESNGSGIRLTATANNGVISGHGITYSSSNTSQTAADFHISNTSKTEIYSKYFEQTIASNNDIGSLMIGDTEYDFSFNTADNTVVLKSGSLPSWITFSTEVNPNVATQIRVKVVVNDDPARDKNIRIKSNAVSKNYGISTISAQLIASNEGLRISNIGDQRVKSNVAVNSLASEVLSIDGMRGEDLIFISGGTRNPLAIGEVKTATESRTREYSLEVNKVDPTSIDIYDFPTGHIVGTRSIANDNNTTFQGLSLDFSGAVAGGDAFKVLVSTNADDASNLNNILDTSLNNERSGVGGYAEIFGHIVSNTGAEIQANQQTLESNEVAYQLALDNKNEFTGVDLDTEAARLMEQQQAYQALARVLTTARELLDTLLRSM